MKRKLREKEEIIYEKVHGIKKRQYEKRQTQWNTQQELPIKRNIHETKSSRQIHLKNVERDKIKNISHIQQNKLSKEIFHSPISKESSISKKKKKKKIDHKQRKVMCNRNVLILNIAEKKLKLNKLNV